MSLDPQRLSCREIHLWQVCVDEFRHASGGSVLDVYERESAKKHIRRKDRRRYEGSHTALRCILAKYLDSRPNELGFSHTVDGKPVLKDRRGIHFSLSHSGVWAVLAIAQSEIGVDLECPRPFPRLPVLMRRVCSDWEQTSLASLPPDAREAAFRQCWTGKEALLKAVGCGLRVDPAAIDVLQWQSDNESTAIVDSTISGQLWRVHWFDVAETYSGALATTISAPRIQRARWSFE